MSTSSSLWLRSVCTVSIWNRIISTHGVYACVDVCICVCRQPWYYGWGFNLPRGQALLDKWNQIPDNTDILVTHCPPLGEICITVCPFPPSLKGHTHTHAHPLNLSSIHNTALTLTSNPPEYWGFNVIFQFSTYTVKNDIFHSSMSRLYFQQVRV